MEFWETYSVVVDHGVRTSSERVLCTGLSGCILSTKDEKGARARRVKRSTSGLTHDGWRIVHWQSNVGHIAYFMQRGAGTRKIKPSIPFPSVP